MTRTLSSKFNLPKTSRRQSRVSAWRSGGALCARTWRLEVPPSTSRRRHHDRLGPPNREARLQIPLCRCLRPKQDSEALRRSRPTGLDLLGPRDLGHLARAIHSRHDCFGYAIVLSTADYVASRNLRDAYLREGSQLMVSAILRKCGRALSRCKLEIPMHGYAC